MQKFNIEITHHETKGETIRLQLGFAYTKKAQAPDPGLNVT